MVGRSLRLDPPLPHPASGAEARQAAQRALALCANIDVDGPAARANTELNRALDPLRLFPAVDVRCGRCEYGLGFVALNTEGATVVSGNKRHPPKRRRGGVYDLDDHTEAVAGQRALPGWQEDAQAGRGPVTPTGERPGAGSGLAQRRTYKCADCHASYTLTNTTLLRRYLDAIGRGDNEIRLN